MKRTNKQKGFTIIELVVVILLLGILTATALPRFMSVENQAHDAVVEAIMSGMTTSSALFRAQWYAEGQPNTVVDYDNMRASRAGYAMGSITGTNPLYTLRNSDNCIQIYQSFLQPVGRPVIDSKPAAGAALASVVTTNGSDFIAYLDTSNSVTARTCYYAYTGQFSSSSLGGVPVISYNTATGVLETVTEL